MKALTKTAIAIAAAATVGLTVVATTSTASGGAEPSGPSVAVAQTAEAADQVDESADAAGVEDADRSADAGAEVEIDDSEAQTLVADARPMTAKRTQYAVQTLNIQSNPLMKRPAVQHDVSKSVALGSDVIMLQEIAPKYYKDAIKNAKVPGKNAGKWEIIGAETAIPIMVRIDGDSPWEIKNSGKQRMHDGKAKVSPHRLINWVVLRNKLTDTKTVFMNTHMVSGAWSNKAKKAKDWRKRMWNQHFTAMSAKIQEFHARGLPVVFGGDFNRRQIPQKFASGERWIVKSGIDKIGYVPASKDVDLRVTRRDTIGGFKSDHNAKLSRFSVGSQRVTPPPPPEPTTKPGGSTKGAAPDPDTVQAPNGKYYTYSTKAGAAKSCDKKGVFWVPVRVTDGPDLRGSCAVGDALPDGPGKWAYGGCKAAVWAPSVVQFKEKWFLFYSASVAGKDASCDKRGQMCIGKAVSSSPRGPFRNAGMVVCPPAGRWAIDPDAFVDGGKLFLVYRDDSTAPRGQSGIAGVQLNDKGEAIMSTRRALMTSLDINWETIGTGPKDHGHIVENPSMVKVNGRYKLFFSGNSWQSKRYSVGVADCGTAPINNRCTFSKSDKNRPWFGYSKSGLNPKHTLTHDHPGPGGMAVFRNNDGQLMAVWHWYPDGPRPSLMAALKNDLTVK